MTAVEVAVASHLTTLFGHVSDVTCLSFSTSMLATCSSDKTIRLWDLKDPEKKIAELSYSPLLGHRYSVHCCCFSPLEDYLATCSTDGNISLWNPNTGERLETLTHPSSQGVRVCGFSPDSSYLISGGEDDNVVVWDVKWKRMIRLIKAHEATVTACCFAPDSSHFITGSTNGDIKLWNVDGNGDIPLAVQTEAHDLGVLGCDFAPTSVADDSKRRKYFLCATCGNDDKVRLWTVSSGLKPKICLRHTLQGHAGNVMSCRFSHDGKYLATTSGDKTAIIWNLSTKGIIQILRGHTRYVTCCAFSSDSRYFSTGSNDKSVIVWKVCNVPNFMNRTTPDLMDIGQCKEVASDSDVPNEFLCPITHELMKDPVMASDGYTYERCAISDWLQGGKVTSPMTNKILTNTQLLPNHTLKMLIQRNTK